MLQWRYTDNILTIKSTEFTCVPVSFVVSLYFWYLGIVKCGKLVFTTSENCVKRAVQVQWKIGRRYIRPLNKFSDCHHGQGFNEKLDPIWDKSVFMQ